MHNTWVGRGEQEGSLHGTGAPGVLARSREGGGGRLCGEQAPRQACPGPWGTPTALLGQGTPPCAVCWAPSARASGPCRLGVASGPLAEESVRVKVKTPTKQIKTACPLAIGVPGPVGLRAQQPASVALTSSSKLLSSVESPHLPSTDTDLSPFFTRRQTWWPWMERLYMEAQESTRSTTEKWW